MKPNPAKNTPFRHSREGGNPSRALSNAHGPEMDPRLRGDDEIEVNS